MADRKIDKYRCPACSAPAEPVYVHGHFQCPVCKVITESCCGNDAPQQEELAENIQIEKKK